MHECANDSNFLSFEVEIWMDVFHVILEENVQVSLLQRLPWPAAVDGGKRTSFHFLWNHPSLWEHVSSDLSWPVLILNMADFFFLFFFFPYPENVSRQEPTSATVAEQVFIPQRGSLACHNPCWFTRVASGLSHFTHYVYSYETVEKGNWSGFLRSL